MSTKEPYSRQHALAYRDIRRLSLPRSLCRPGGTERRAVDVPLGRGERLAHLRDVRERLDERAVQHARVPREVRQRVPQPPVVLRDLNASASSSPDPPQDKRSQRAPARMGIGNY